MAYQRKSGNLKTIWRINHRPEDFSHEELEYFLREQIIVVNGNAFDEFKFISREDYFYLHHGNQNQCKKYWLNSIKI